MKIKKTESIEKLSVYSQSIMFDFLEAYRLTEQQAHYALRASTSQDSQYGMDLLILVETIGNFLRLIKIRQFRPMNLMKNLHHADNDKAHEE